MWEGFCDVFPLVATVPVSLVRHFPARDERSGDLVLWMAKEEDLDG